jgi:hypothetical protein
MGKIDVKYRTFDELLYEVNGDFVMYNNEGMIEPGQLIKVAQRVNYDLGMRIHSTKERVLELTKGRVRLPEDFHVLNYAMLLGRYRVKSPVLSGRQLEEKVLEPATPNCNHCGAEPTTCDCNYTAVQPCGEGTNQFVLVEKIKTEVRVYDFFEKVQLSPGKFVSTATGQSEYSANNAEIKNGFIYTNIDEGRIYLNYEGALEDDEGNLLVLDHPMINEYYEYALKKRILENLFMNGEDVAQRIQLIEPLYRAARNNALSIVNTPDFQDLYNVWAMNRKAQYHKYYQPFSSSTNTTYK